MHFKVKNLGKKNGEGMISIIFRDCQGKEFAKSTGVKVAPANFSTKNGRISARDADNVEKNRAVNEVRQLFDIVERTALERGEVLHSWQFAEKMAVLEEGMNFLANMGQSVANKLVSRVDGLRDEIAQLRALLAEKEETLTFLETGWKMEGAEPQPLFTAKLAEFIVWKRANLVKESTLSNYEAMGAVIARFRPNLQVKDINLTLFQDFQQHLIKKGKRNSTIGEMFVKFTAFYKWAARALKLDIDWLQDFTVVSSVKDENVIFLTKEELAGIEALPIKTKGQHRTRELFLLAVETGLRFSDMLVKREQVQEMEYDNGKGETARGKVLLLPTKKVGKFVRIPLTAKAINILERNNYQFSRPTEPHFNQALRALGKKVSALQHVIQRSWQVGTEMKYESMPKYEALTCHVGRKTFINNAIERGVSQMTVAQWVGHSDTKMIESHYAHKGEAAKREAYKILAN